MAFALHEQYFLSVAPEVLFRRVQEAHRRMSEPAMRSCRNPPSPIVVSMKEQALTITLFRFLLPLALASTAAFTSVAWAGEYFEKDGVDIPGQVAKADRNWPVVSKQTQVIE